MLREEIISAFLEMTKQTNALYVNEITKAGKQEELSFAESEVLLYLNRFPEQDTAKHVVERCCMSKAYVSKSVEQLVQKEFLKIEIDKKDRRCQHLHCTKKAKEYVIKLEAIVSHFFDIASKDIPKERMEIALSMIYAITNNVETYMQEEK